MSSPCCRLAALALAAATLGLPQDVMGAKAGLVYYGAGNVSIAESAALAVGPVNRQLLEGKTLISENGRAEVRLNHGTVLRIGEGTRVRMNSLALTHTHLSLETSSAVVTLNSAPKFDRVIIHIGHSIVTPAIAGVYRVDVDDVIPMSILRVFRGEAKASFPDANLTVLAKTSQELRLADFQPGRFDPNHADTLQQWAEGRGQRLDPK